LHLPFWAALCAAIRRSIASFYTTQCNAADTQSLRTTHYSGTCAHTPRCPLPIPFHVHQLFAHSFKCNPTVTSPKSTYICLKHNFAHPHPVSKATCYRHIEEAETKEEKQLTPTSFQSRLTGCQLHGSPRSHHPSHGQKAA